MTNRLSPEHERILNEITETQPEQHQSTGNNPHITINLIPLIVTSMVFFGLLAIFGTTTEIIYAAVGLFIGLSAISDCQIEM